jgi:phage terminase large subunit
MPELDLPEYAEVLWDTDARHIALHGGRGGGKSRSVASALVMRGAQNVERFLCCREIQKSIKDSVKRLLDDEIDRLGLRWFYTSTETEIRGNNGTLFIFAGLRSNISSIKSLEGITCVWVEEAQVVSQTSLDVLIPTIRQPGSQLIYTWNPVFDSDPVDRMFRGENGPPPRSIVKQVNWNDNLFFPSDLKEQAEFDRATDPDKYEHVWNGGYVTAIEGAYYASALAQARKEGRISFVAADPLMTYRAAWDIGGTGAKADATAIWVYQRVGMRVLVLDYYEASGQPLAVHVAWLRDNGYEKALCILPHDGASHEKIIKSTYQGALEEAGFRTRIVPNQGAGAAMARVEAARRLFPQIWFNEDTTRGGLKTLAGYHEKRDPDRGIGLGPSHDKFSHGADAFGLMCISDEPPQQARKIVYTARGIV